MDDQKEALLRREKLEQDLALEVRACLKRGRFNYFTSYLLRLVMVLSSVTAGLLGFAGGDAQFLGGVALIPALIAFLSSNMKFQDKANWHYRKAEAFNGLRDELLYEVPCPISCAAVAAISNRKRECSDKMNFEWESSFSMETSISKLILPKTNGTVPSLPEG